MYEPTISTINEIKHFYFDLQTYLFRSWLSHSFSDLEELCILMQQYRIQLHTISFFNLNIVIPNNLNIYIGPIAKKDKFNVWSTFYWIKNWISYAPWIIWKFHIPSFPVCAYMFMHALIIQFWVFLFFFLICVNSLHYKRVKNLTCIEKPTKDGNLRSGESSLNK